MSEYVFVQYDPKKERPNPRNGNIILGTEYRPGQKDKEGRQVTAPFFGNITFEPGSNSITEEDYQLLSQNQAFLDRVAWGAFQLVGGNKVVKEGDSHKDLLSFNRVNAQREISLQTNTHILDRWLKAEREEAATERPFVIAAILRRKQFLFDQSLSGAGA